MSKQHQSLYPGHVRGNLPDPGASGHTDPEKDPFRIPSVIPILCSICDTGGDDLPGDHRIHTDTGLGILALAAGILAAWFGASLFQVASLCCVVVLD